MICFEGGMDLMEFVFVLLPRNDRKDDFDSSMRLRCDTVFFDRFGVLV